MSDRICVIAGCGQKQCGRGWCSSHYHRWRQHGDPEAYKAGKPLEFIHALLAGSDDGDCIIWPYARISSGYGTLRYEGKQQLAHRVLCALRHGPAPDGDYHAAHSCGKGHKGCVAPHHLRWASRVENFLDKKQHGTQFRGSTSPAAKLSEALVVEIRKRLAAGESQLSIARSIGVKGTTIGNVARGVTWTHVP